MKRNSKILLVVFVFCIFASLIITSAYNWLYQNRLGAISRYFYLIVEKAKLEKVYIAPFQYRILQPVLVYAFFQHIPFPWRDTNYEIVSGNIFSTGKLESMFMGESSELNLFPCNSKEEFNELVKKIFMEAVENSVLDTELKSQILKIAPEIDYFSALDNAGTYLFSIFSRIFPSFEEIDISGSEINKFANGYLTSNFFYIIFAIFFLYLILKEFVKPPFAFMGILLFCLSLFITMNVNSPETFLTLAFFSAGLYLTIKRSNPVLTALVLAAGSFSRADQMLFVAMIYFCTVLFDNKKRKNISAMTIASAILLIPVVVQGILTFVLFPGTKNPFPFSNLMANLTNPWAWFFLLCLFNVSILFPGEIKRNTFLKKTWPALVVFLAINFFGGLIEEIRIIIPAAFYLMIPSMLGIERIFKNHDNQILERVD